MPDERLLSTAEVAQRYAIHPKTVHRFVAQGRLPRPVRLLGKRILRWRESDINEHIRSLEQIEQAAQG